MSMHTTDAEIEVRARAIASRITAEDALVERLAKALHESRRGRMFLARWDALMDHRREMYRVDVRAVLAALKEER